MHFKSATVIATACCGLFAQNTYAQNYGRVGRPATRYNTPVLSPYLNLVGAAPGGAFEQQLFLRTVPELQLRDAATDSNKRLNSLQRDVQRQERQATSSQLGSSGHKTAFQNLGGYFPGSNRR